MKERSAIYVPVKEDQLDEFLGQFINSTNDPHKLTKLFLREREGVYQFGTKRVYVKMENGKIFSKSSPLLLQSELEEASSALRSS